MMKRRIESLLMVSITAILVSGCGGRDNSVKVSEVDDSVVHSEEQMKSMEEQYKADSGSR